MATVSRLIELYKSVMELLAPLKGVFGAGSLPYIRAGGMILPDWTKYGAGDFSGDFGGAAVLTRADADYAAGGGFGGFVSRSAAGKAAGLDGLDGLDGLGVWDVWDGFHGSGGLNGLNGFDFAIKLPDNGGFFYTDFGGNSAVGEREFNPVSEKIRDGGIDFRIADSAFGIITDNGGRLGTDLEKQFEGKESFGAIELYRGYPGEWEGFGNSGEYRGRLFSLGEAGLAPNGRSEDFDIWKSTEHLRYTDTLGAERLTDIRGYAEQEGGGFGGGEVRVDMSGMRNIVNNQSDMDELIDRLCGAFTEAAFSMAEGVHY